MTHRFWYWSIIKCLLFVIYTIRFLRAVKILANLIAWHILALSCSGINSSINSIYFSWYGSDNQVTTGIQLDQRGSLLFPADDRVWVPTWVNAQTFLTPFRSKYRKMIHSGVIAKASSLLIKKTDFHFFPYLMSYLRVKMVDLTWNPYGPVGV